MDGQATLDKKTLFSLSPEKSLIHILQGNPKQVPMTSLESREESMSL